jgi:hypothetical protein
LKIERCRDGSVGFRAVVGWIQSLVKRPVLWLLWLPRMHDLMFSNPVEYQHLATRPTTNSYYTAQQDCEQEVSQFNLFPEFSMATRTLESRFEHLSVNDENDPNDGTKYQKSKVNTASTGGFLHC